MTVVFEKNMYKVGFAIEEILSKFHIDTQLIPDEDSYVSCSLADYFNKGRVLLYKYEISSKHIFSAEFKHSGDPTKGNLNYFISDELGLPFINRTWSITSITLESIINQLNQDLQQVLG